MKNLAPVVFMMALGIISCTSKYKDTINTDHDYMIIPKPVLLEKSNGRFLIDSNTQIFAQDGLDNESHYLLDLLAKPLGFRLKTSTEDKANGNIILKLSDQISEKEGYELTITHKNITITGKTATGVFYGIQSLRQMLPAKAEHNPIETLTVAAVTIKDHPRYPYRGMHLDVGRHFFPVAFIKKYIDLIALHKMNNFHWHLTEDQGWRIEIKKYPKLTSIGSKRSGTVIVERDENVRKHFLESDNKPYGGYYTQEQVKEIVAYAAKRHINIIPEIEMPGHSLAALAAYPEFGNTDIIPLGNNSRKYRKAKRGEKRTYEVGTMWGVMYPTYAPKESTFKFLEDILTEVMSLFPSPFIHIGGDEAPKEEWEQSRFAQKFIKKKGLKDAHELQSYFITRIEKFLNKHNRNIIGWDEILEGGLAPNATVMSWRGIKGGIEAAKQHHNVIMTPGSHCYFDHYQVDTKEAKLKEPLSIGGGNTVAHVYSYEPTPKELNEEEQQYIQGAQGNVWTEYMKTTDHVTYMALPRMTALSEVVWSSKEQRNWDDFKTRLEHLRNRYDALGVRYAQHTFKK